MNGEICVIKLRVICCFVLLLVLCSCSAGNVAEESVWISQGYLKDECVAQIGEKLYTYLPGENENIREYLYEIDKTGNKTVVICDKEGCAHEQQGHLVDPCNAFDYATLGLMADGEFLYSGSHNGSVGISRHSIKNGSKETVLQTELPISCFYVEDGSVYYAQQDQNYGEPVLRKEDNGYRLFVRSTDQKTQEPKLLYERKGVIGYIACIQKFDEVMFLTEVFYPSGNVQDATMNVVMLNGESGEIVRVVENAGGHNIAKIGLNYAIPSDSIGMVLVDEKGMVCKQIDCGKKAMCIGVEGYLLVDSVVDGERELSVYNDSGERMGKCFVTEAYSDMLGADQNYVYYWKETGEKALLEGIDWRVCIEKSAA